MNPNGAPTQKYCRRGHEIAVVGRTSCGYCRPCAKMWREKPAVALKRRAQHLKTKFGLSVDAYDGLFSKQSGRCRICNEEKRLCVDHDHATGKIRGLLCIKCNTWLGIVENISFTVKARAYLRGQNV